MKSRFFNYLVTLLVFFCLTLTATSVTAKKPIKPPPDDPCLSQQSFTPDFVFWRDTGKGKNLAATIFVAESDTGCEQLLVEFPLGDSGGIKNLKFSSIEDASGSFLSGRVVWANELSLVAQYVWVQDFEIVENVVVPSDSPVPILRNELMGGTDLKEDVSDLDLSPDTQKLVYEYALRDLVAERVYYSFRILDIDDCIDGPCGFNTEYAYELDSSSDAISGGFGGFKYPSWGPFGNRIYVVRRFREYRDLQFFDLEWNAPIGPTTFTTGLLLPGTTNWISKPVSGINEGTGTEYLAIQNQFSEVSGCKGIFLIDVKSCDPFCSWPEPEFAGEYPSWTKGGKLVHLYNGWTPPRKCAWRTSIGSWSSKDNSLEKLLDGMAPNAAGGYVE